MPALAYRGLVCCALAVSVITGITFGTHPAWKAAQLDPLTALRHE